MKKIIASILAAACVASSVAFCAGCSPREEQLRIYNWGDYMDEGLCAEFESWYETQTGEKIKVQYDTFDTNEDMITRIEVQKEDYDLVCPSDYMAERMIKSELVQKVDSSIFDIHADGLFYDGLMDMIKPFDKSNEYFVPYVWGTFGIMYDTNKIAPGTEAMTSWSAFWNDDYKYKMLMKDSVRDAYSIARIYGSRDRLSELSDGFTNYGAEYKAEIEKIYSEINEDQLSAAKTLLQSQALLNLKYEVDDGKNDMLAGTTEAHFGFFWSCDAGLIMQEEGGNHFYYTVPKEGANVWVDGWMIPKYAGNTKAANYFLKFINMHEYAAVNLDYLGTSIAVKSVMDEAKSSIVNDAEFEKGFYAGYKDMYLDLMFPSENTLSRCGVMRDFGAEYNTKLDEMWIDVKTSVN